LLDYDGTLAPFTVERDKALPYPGVMEALQRVLRTTRTQVIFVSGRGAHGLDLLLKPYSLNCEIWGAHGRERLRADGTYQEFLDDRRTPSWLERTGQLLRLKGLNELIELKPGSLAVHWRGLDVPAQKAAKTAALGAFAFLRTKTACRAVEFDGGIELLVGNRGKGEVVRTIVEELPGGAAIAYLGDDVTDEDAFLALRNIGLTVLVRPEYRPTNAEIWIKPPEELIGFLKKWGLTFGGTG
jgi:trehalose-phosphatase